jgi:hypothetical protein
VVKRIEDVKMNWKKFLKPDRRKIVVFVVFIILPVLWIFNQNIPTYIFLYIPFSLCTIFPGCVIGDGELPRINNELFILSFIITYIVWYLFSCLIVWIYDKVNRK